jgi:hypothetical protein
MYVLYFNISQRLYDAYIIHGQISILYRLIMKGKFLAAFKVTLINTNPSRYHDPLTQKHVKNVNTVYGSLTVFTLFT